MLLLRPICGNRHQSLDRQAYLVAVSGFCRDNLANISTIIRIMIFLFWGQALAKKNMCSKGRQFGGFPQDHWPSEISGPVFPRSLAPFLTNFRPISRPEVRAWFLSCPCLSSSLFEP